MRIRFSASVLLVSLLILSGLLALLFLAKDNILNQDKLSQYYYFDYLKDKLKLINEISVDEHRTCQEEKKEIIRVEFNTINYTFYCELKSIFIKPKPTREKYIAVDNIRDWLDIDKYASEIFTIHDLTELPPSSEQQPIIVIALAPIDQRLEQDFYGIIITDFHFDITGKRFYGVLYSSYDNAREERNLSYRRTVIDNIEKHFAQWRYLPNSRNIITND